ncbi:hypothetical protein DFH27DRAFT_605379 [Peziza echinospora]|nr:hypothetical protein DFH27DRAFT_605379 [Peziza echinospora]
MATHASPPFAPVTPGSHNTPPSTPSPNSIARRGRRPALIPPTAELSAIFASGTFSPSSHVTAYGTILNQRASLFVLPPSLPDGGNPSSMAPPLWRGLGHNGDVSPFGWDSEEDEDEYSGMRMGFGGQSKHGLGNGAAQKGELKKLLGAGVGIADDGDGDAMEIDDDERREVEGDVFSWVNSSHDDHPSPLPNLASLPAYKHAQHHVPGNMHLQIPALRRRASDDDEDEGSSGTWTVPTSPLSGTFGDDLELQRRRLEQAGLGSGMEGVESG